VKYIKATGIVRDVVNDIRWNKREIKSAGGIIA
jgi:hypothetical protein